MVLLLIRNLADVAERTAPSVREVRLRCELDRTAVEATPTLLKIAGHSIAGNYPAKRTFHYQARRALARLAEAIELAPDEARINTAMGGDDDDGTTEPRHADIQIRVVPRLVRGRIHYTRWTDNDKIERYGVEIIADEVTLLSYGKSRQAARTDGPGSDIDDDVPFWASPKRGPAVSNAGPLSRFGETGQIEAIAVKFQTQCDQPLAM